MILATIEFSSGSRISLGKNGRWSGEDESVVKAPRVPPKVHRKPAGLHRTGYSLLDRPLQHPHFVGVHQFLKPCIIPLIIENVSLCIQRAPSRVEPRNTTK